jgi:hypothetical protein
MKIKSKEELLVKSFVQSVSSPTTYTKRYKKVCQLLDSRPVLTEEQWLYVWRGFYYSIWYSEMGKGCEQLAQTIGTCDDLSVILSGFKSLTNDWFGIDAFRVDKFMFLVRIMANNCLKLQLNYLLNKSLVEKSIETLDKSLDKKTDDLSNDNVVENEGKVEETVEEVNDRNVELVDKNQKKSSKRKDRNNENSGKKFGKKKESTKQEIEFPVEMRAELIDNILTIVNSSVGLTLHLNDLFIDELIKVMNEFKTNWNVKQKFDVFFDMLLPFVKLLALTEDNRLRNSIKEEIFDRFKNEIIISESIDTRKSILEKFVEAMIAIGSVPQVCKRNRDAIYNIVRLYKSKINSLSSSNDIKGVKRRKIVQKRGKHKKVKYEITSSTPFVRSIVPIAVV